jgi:GxxExxY protein
VRLLYFTAAGERRQEGAVEDSLSESVIGVAIEVHRGLGPGLLETVYERVLALELTDAGFQVRRQVQLPVRWKQHVISPAYRLDLLVNDALVVEVKCVEHVLAVHKAQVRSYVKLGGFRTALLLNFQTALLKDGIHRLW